MEFLRISFLRRTPLVADSESDAHPQANSKALNVVIITKFSYNFAMKESWHDSVLQFMHILCYCDKQHQAKTICYFYKPEKYKFFCLSNLSKLSTCLFINNLYKQLDSINTESIWILLIQKQSPNGVLQNRHSLKYLKSHEKTPVLESVLESYF